MEVFERIVITKELIAAFAELTGDYNPIHLEESAAALTVFGRPIAHGILLVSFFSKIIAQQYPGPGSIYLTQNIDFKAPCYVGDEIEVTVKLNQQVGAIYLLDTFISDSSKKVLVNGVAKILKK